MPFNKLRMSEKFTIQRILSLFSFQVFSNDTASYSVRFCVTDQIGLLWSDVGCWKNQEVRRCSNG
jgi:hypothetical protein